jgi:hypothetical protein
MMNTYLPQIDNLDALCRVKYGLPCCIRTGFLAVYPWKPGHFQYCLLEKLTSVYTVATRYE